MGKEEDMEELSLELSIGGKYGKAENLKENSTGFLAERDSSRFETTDPQRRREIQALRRQEARRKREEKVKKSRGLNVGFVDDMLFVEAQRSEARVRDREIREKDCLFKGKIRKNGSGEVADELGLSLFSEKNQREKKCLYAKVQIASSSIDCDSEYSNGVKSLEQCSSAVSDYRSLKGASSSETGSDSSSLLARRHHGGDRIETDRFRGGANLAPISNPQPTWMKSTDSPGATNVSSTSEKTSGGCVNNQPPKAASYGPNAGCLPRMPCVSATGNGPNGKTVMGFLYRYNKTEVSIMCVCHRSLLTPAEFVEHAGSIDVCHPLRHITVVPPATR